MPNSVVKTLTVNGTTYDLKDVDSESYAPKASPALTGTPTAPTATSGTNNTQIATTAFVQDAVSGVTSGIPSPSSSTPIMDGTAAVGTSTDYARADHVHPVDAIPITAAEIDEICNMDSVIYSASSPTIGSGQIGSMVVSRTVGSIVEGGQVGTATVG